MPQSIEISEFSNCIMNSCIGVSLSSVLVILFVMSTSKTLSLFIGLSLVFILSFIIYYTSIKTNKIANDLKINIWSENELWNPIKTNILSGHILTLFLVFLIISVVIKLF